MLLKRIELKDKEIDEIRLKIDIRLSMVEKTVVNFIEELEKHDQDINTIKYQLSKPNKKKAGGPKGSKNRK